MGIAHNRKEINIGDKFGRWAVIKEVEKNKHNKRQFLCECSCEKKIRKIVELQVLTFRKSKSCGCFKTEVSTKINYKHGIGYYGISLYKPTMKYLASIRYKNKIVFREATFKSSQQAALARDIFIIKNELPHKLNFPELAINGPL